MMNFEKKFILPFLKYPLKCKFDGQTLTKCDFLKGRFTQIFFQEMCYSGGKQTIHKVSAAFIVKNCHPWTSLTLKSRTAWPIPAIYISFSSILNAVSYVIILFSRCSSPLTESKVVSNTIDNVSSKSDKNFLDRSLLTKMLYNWKTTPLNKLLYWLQHPSAYLWGCKFKKNWKEFNRSR